MAIYGRRTLYMVFGVLLLVAISLPQRVFAASASLYLSPSSSNVNQGSTVTVNIYENSGPELINAVQAYLSYPANLLDFVSISSSSAFGVVAENSGGAGSVKIARGALPAVSGTQLVATVRFKAKTSSGTAAISFSPGSQVLSANSNSNILTSSAGGNYSLRPAAAQPATPADTISPTISDIKVVEIVTDAVSIIWTTSEPSTSEIAYGPSQEYGLIASDSTLVTEHKIILDSAFIKPATTYHFMVRSTDTAGNSVTSENQTFTTKGLSLSIKVLNHKNKPVKGAKVTLSGKSITTDSNGRGLIENLVPGSVEGFVEYRGKKTPVRVDVKTSAPDGPQEITFKISTKPAIVWFLIGPLALLLLLAWLLKYKKLNFRSMQNLHFRSQRQPDSIVPVPGQLEHTIVKPTDGIHHEKPK